MGADGIFRSAAGGLRMRGVSEREPHPGDLSDERWALIEPVITEWKVRERARRLEGSFRS
ncbi:hypothetical protein GCM10010302_17550 [Streptomyces polychromogenes]|uniref:Transposase n=1 Tax=Streptomyces polychromogenes TaxID=67342 RepID=A0ABP3EXB3_9ACTN